MKGLNQIPLIIGFALLLSCSGGKQGETGVSVSLAGAESVDAADLRAADSVRLASLNSPGSIANDFEFVDRSGQMGTMHGFAAHGNGKWKVENGECRVMLIFYDPECPHCNDILRELSASRSLNEAIACGEMAVLAIYAEGKRDVWEAANAAMPANWQVGYDLTGILDADLYDLPAMPIIYLLDSTGRVLLKDPDYRIFLDPDE